MLIVIDAMNTYVLFIITVSRKTKVFVCIYSVNNCFACIILVNYIINYNKISVIVDTTYTYLKVFRYHLS